MGKSKISWTDYTWNPITGCTKVSDGCKHCYAERLSKRLAGRGGYPKENPFAVTLHADKLDEPLRWREPRMIFVCSMGDLFHEDVKDGWIDEVFQVMKEARQHTFLILTKRVRSMWDYCFDIHYEDKCLPNVWLGTSVENQKTADLRIPILLQIPAAKRFISCEPLLGPVDLSGYLADLYILGERPELTIIESSLDWVICGGESGPGARPMHPEWVRGLRDQCLGSGARFHFKSWGEWAAADQLPAGIEVESRNGPAYAQYTFEDGLTVYRVGAKKSGRLLDGKEWQ